MTPSNRKPGEGRTETKEVASFEASQTDPLQLAHCDGIKDAISIIMRHPCRCPREGTRPLVPPISMPALYKRFLAQCDRCNIIDELSNWEEKLR